MTQWSAWGNEIEEHLPFGRIQRNVCAIEFLSKGPDLFFRRIQRNGRATEFLSKGSDLVVLLGAQKDTEKGLQ